MNSRKKVVVLAVCVILCLAVGSTFAWYLREDAKRAQTEAATVMAPYNLYLLGPNAQDKLQFAVGNLHPGETKQTVVCVSNKKPRDDEDGDLDMAGQAKESVFGYDLMLVHTENLAVEYEVYPLERYEQNGNVLDEDAIIMDDDTKDTYYWKKTAASLQGSDISEDMRKRVFGAEEDTSSIVNAGTYWLSDDDTMELAYRNGDYEYDYYLIEVKWQDITNFDDYKKETDLVYVVVNAKQPRPVEK